MDDELDTKDKLMLEVLKASIGNLSTPLSPPRDDKGRAFYKRLVDGAYIMADVIIDAKKEAGNAANIPG